MKFERSRLVLGLFLEAIALCLIMSLIMENVPKVNMHLLHAIPFVSIEDEQKFDRSLIQTLAGIIEILPSFEG